MIETLVLLEILLIVRVNMQDIANLKYIICCPLCDNLKCVKGTEDCEAEQWQRKKESEGVND